MFESIDAVIRTAETLAQIFGLPVLFLIFVSKGLLIGKIFPTSVFLPGYVILTGASRPMAAVIVVVTAIGYIIGQFVVFLGCRKYGRSFLTRLPYMSVSPDDERFDKFDAWFRVYGGISIFVTNFIPWIRGLVTIPAATSSYATVRYLFHTTASTLLYHAVYVVVALGALSILT